MTYDLCKGKSVVTCDFLAHCCKHMSPERAQSVESTSQAQRRPVTPCSYCKGVLFAAAALPCGASQTSCTYIHIY
jgi:hypothetical protein